MKFLKKDSNKWVLTSQLIKLAKENSMSFILGDYIVEDEKRGYNIELDISPNEDIYSVHDDFNCDDHVSYIINFNPICNNNYSMELNYCYQMDLELEKDKFPKEIKTIKELSSLLKEIKKVYDEKYL